MASIAQLLAEAAVATGKSAGKKLAKGKEEEVFADLSRLLGEPEGIKAFHGSPHDFDKFDMSKIGTGEGAQAYGHGHVFCAQREGVERSYRGCL
jgi:hypothetical protein